MLRRLPRIAAASAALFAAAALSVPAASAADKDHCKATELCFYQADAQGQEHIVYRTPLVVTEEGVSFKDIEKVDPPFTTDLAVGSLPSVDDCSVYVFPDAHYGGDSEWVGNGIRRLPPGTKVGSMMMDCG